MEDTPRELYLIRDIILKREGFDSYDQYLKSTYWENIKQKVKTPKYRDKYNECRVCRSRKDIHLHHENYRWLLTAFELRSIIPLCVNCHQNVHYVARQLNVNFVQARKIYTYQFELKRIGHGDILHKG